MTTAQQTVRGAVEPRILVKAAISVVFGLVAFGVSIPFTNLPHAGAYGVAISLFVGGVAFVVQFLYDVERRLEWMEEAYSIEAEKTAHRITEGFKKINEATELFGLVEASALKTDAMTQLVRNSTRIEASPLLVFEFVQAEISRLSEMLKEISDSGVVTYEGEDRDWMLGLTKSAKHTIDATSLTTVDAGGRGFVDGGLWASDLGQRYLDTQRDAVRRGVQIRRVFIMDRPELLTDPDFMGVCQMHEDIGIETRILHPSRIPGTRRDSLFDFIIFDGVLSYQATPASRVGDYSRPVIVNTQLIQRATAVTDRIQRFQDLWRAAAPAQVENQ
jgi:hypothetical protein